MYLEQRLSALLNYIFILDLTPVVSFTKEVNPRLAKRPLVFNGRLANCGLASLVKEATDVSGLDKDNCKTDEKDSSFGICCALY